MNPSSRIDTARWLVLIYAGGYNDLQPEIAAAIAQLRTTPLPPEVEAAVLVSPAPDELVSLLRFHEFLAEIGPAPRSLRLVTDPRSRLLVPDRHWPRRICPMHLPGSLRAFLDWGLRLAPGARVTVILAGHAAGLLGVMMDYAPGYPMLMTIPALAGTLRKGQEKAGRRIGMLVLDTCYLNTVEVVYELAGPGMPGGRYLILPVDDAPRAGMPYARIFDTLKASTGVWGLETAAAGIVGVINDCWRGMKRTCIGLRLEFTALERLRGKLDRLAASLVATGNAGCPTGRAIREIHRLLAQSLSPLTIRGGGIEAGSPEASIHCYLPQSAERFSLVADAYLRLGFTRGEHWRRLLPNHPLPSPGASSASAERASADPGIVALPHQLYRDSRSPGDADLTAGLDAGQAAPGNPGHEALQYQRAGRPETMRRLRESSIMHTSGTCRVVPVFYLYTSRHLASRGRHRQGYPAPRGGTAFYRADGKGFDPRRRS